MPQLLKLYDFFTHRPAVLKGLVLALTLLFIGLAMRLRYKEDIFDFLPQNETYTESMRVYSSLSEASRIVFIFEAMQPDSIACAIDELAEICPSAVTEMDMDAVAERLRFIYAHLPYFLSEESYALLDAVYAQSDTLLPIMRGYQTMMSLPGTSFLQTSLIHDPLRLVPLNKVLTGQYAGAQSQFTSYNGYMMSSDHSKGFAFYDSPYGSTETGRNAALVDSLTSIATSVQQRHPSVSVRLLGAPVVAVTNARQIKKDSLFAIALSLLLIIALLCYSFPRKKDIWLILLSVAFGWLVGMATLAVWVREVSVIVLGIGAILIGIGINYPLHLLVHQRYTTSVRQTLQEVLSPLIIGNITTVGAFMALIPLHSPALKQLGIFASSMLLGTIFFCVIILPHLMTDEPTVVRELPLLSGKRRLTHSRWMPWVMGISLAALAIFVATSHYTLFDANLSHINYMTEQQRRDFAWFEHLSPVSDEPSYLTTTAREELQARAARWEAYWQTHDIDFLSIRIEQAQTQCGFRQGISAPFIQSLRQPVEVVDWHDSNTLAQLWPGKFDTNAMNQFITQTLTDNFDYIGVVCSLIVFVFLWLSFRRFRLALIAFLPMLVSWILITAAMQAIGLQFNIVNVILATFIFGQGDDYTIFVVEGLLYEQQHDRRILDNFKQSILLSALVMLLSIGVLVLARHPVMHSLGLVTLIGMSSVVLMAFLLPPVLFRWLIKKKG